MSNVNSQIDVVNSKIQVLQFEKLVGDDDWGFQGVVVNGVAMITGRWTNKRTFNSKAWGNLRVARISNGWTTSDEYGAWSIDNGNVAGGWFSIYGDTINFRTRSQYDVGAGTWHYVTIIAPVHK